MKFDILVNGVRLNTWGSAQITLDAAYSANAQFLIHSPGVGPWLTNLSKVLITGRDCRPESASWGFENPTDLAAWNVTSGLTSAGLDYTQSAYGAGSWALDWSAPAKTVRIFQTFDMPRNMFGNVFWGWFHLAYLTTFLPQVTVQAYASDGKNEWNSTRVSLSALPTIGWQSCGLRIVQTNTVPTYPTAVTEWGFRLEFSEAIPGDLPATVKLFRLNVDSVELCGRAYAESFLLPPFDLSQPPNGCLHPPDEHTCAKWDEFNWADELHLTPADLGWCPAGASWDDGVSKWGDAKYPLPTDTQWG